jgi:DUF4097 and DUF4098 domain-containing protein YvlB
MAKLRVTIGSGKVRIVGEVREAVEVKGATATALGADTIVQAGSRDVKARVPAGTDIVVGCRSGDIVLEGVLGAVVVTTSSGDIRAETVGSIDARTVSGDVRVKLSYGPARLRTESGKVRVGRVEGETRVATSSGTITIRDAAGAVTAQTTSGDIKAAVNGGEMVGVETLSGKITIKLPPGVRPEVQHRAGSGTTKVKVEEGTDLVISARTTSGNLVVETA